MRELESGVRVVNKKSGVDLVLNDGRDKPEDELREVDSRNLTSLENMIFFRARIIAFVCLGLVIKA